jgi:hypothetical protein
MEVIYSFEGFENQGIDHFQSLFRAQEGSSIAEIVQIA